MDGSEVLRAEGECRAFLGAAVDRDWTRQIPGREWSVAQVVAHIAGGLLWANGRVDLPGQERQTGWRWHCAPLAEWDGADPRGRA
jgi:hypothetical protein